MQEFMEEEVVCSMKMELVTGTASKFNNKTSQESNIKSVTKLHMVNVNMKLISWQL